MTPALAPGSGPTPRVVFVFAPNGKKMDDWRPRAPGLQARPSFLLEPLEPVWRQTLVLSGLCIDGGFAHGDGTGDHARASASFLTCAHPVKTGGKGIRAGVSIDQVIASGLKEAGTAERFMSLELGMEQGSSAGICDSGYSCAYSNNISWRRPDAPTAKEVDPRGVYERLFGDPQRARNSEVERRRMARRRSVLDAVLEDAKSLRRTLGGQDRAKVDDYLDSVREVEQRIGALEQQAHLAAVSAPAVPDGLLDGGRSFADRLALMYELIVLALATGSTRVVSFMLGNAGSNRSYRFLGVPQGHHNLSHHGGKAGSLAAVRRINRFHTEQFGRFLERLSAAGGEGRSLLDETYVVYGSGISDGNLHNHDDLPVVVCGGEDGLRGGRHLVLPDRTPMANLYLALQHRLGVDGTSFADSTGALDLG